MSKGALFLHRHRRREALEAPADTQETGVRLSIPLNRIAYMHFGGYSDFPFIASFRIKPAVSEYGEGGTAEPQVIHLGTITPNHLWTHLDDFITAASQRLKDRPAEQFPVFIDFGPLVYGEVQAPSEGNMLYFKEMKIRGALSLDSRESQLWCKYSCTASVKLVS